MRWPSIARTAAAPDPGRGCWCRCSICSCRLPVHLGGPQAGIRAAGDQQVIGIRCRREQSAIGLDLETVTTNLATNRRVVYANLLRYAGLAFLVHSG